MLLIVLLFSLLSSVSLIRSSSCSLFSKCSGASVAISESLNTAELELFRITGLSSVFSLSCSYELVAPSNSVSDISAFMSVCSTSDSLLTVSSVSLAGDLDGCDRD